MQQKFTPTFAKILQIDQGHYNHLTENILSPIKHLKLVWFTEMFWFCIFCLKMAIRFAKSTKLSGRTTKLLAHNKRIYLFWKLTSLFHPMDGLDHKIPMCKKMGKVSSLEWFICYFELTFRSIISNKYLVISFSMQNDEGKWFYLYKNTFIFHFVTMGKYINFL